MGLTVLAKIWRLVGGSKSVFIAKINRWNNSFQNMYDMLQAKVGGIKNVGMRERYFFLGVQTRKSVENGTVS